MYNLTEKFLNTITDMFAHDIPQYVYKKAKGSLADYIAVSLAGQHSLGDKLLNYVELNKTDQGHTTVIGMHQKLNLKDAVFINGLSGHALDFDDGTNTGIIHLGSPIFSVLLPLAERYHIDSDKFLKAAIIGYETSFTMAVSIQPKHKQMGYHATGTCGVLGIAMAVAYMLDFTPKQTQNAFATACASATGMLSVLDNGSELKPYNVAKTALMGLISTQMAKAGFVGNPDSLGSYRGFLRMMAGDENIELIEPMLYGTYAIEKSYTKPYAACRYCHPSIEAAIKLRNEYGIQTESIESIIIRTYDLAVKGHEHTDIPSSSSAKMSIPYSVAVALTYGKAGLREYNEVCVTNKKILELTRKIVVIPDEKCSVSFPEKQTAIVKINTIYGKNYEGQVDFPKGEPENPMTEEEFTDRFIELAVYGGKTEEEAERILSFIMNMKGDMDDLFEIL